MRGGCHGLEVLKPLCKAYSKGTEAAKYLPKSLMDKIRKPPPRAKVCLVTKNALELLVLIIPGEPGLACAQ